MIRLCLLVMRSRGRFDDNHNAARRGRDLVARPRQPIRVHLARDEELGINDEPERDILEAPELASPPPAYGLWRCSVVSFPKSS